MFDECWGERVYVVVVVRVGAAFDVDEVLAFCAECLVGYKWSWVLEVVDVLLVLVIGKVFKRELRVCYMVVVVL